MRCAGRFLPHQAVRKALVHEMVNSSLTHGVRTHANMRKSKLETLKNCYQRKGKPVALFFPEFPFLCVSKSR